MHRRGFLMMLATAGLGLALMAAPALAQSLDQMRASGKVGERYDGYAVARDSSPQVQNFVAQVNRQRKDIYTERARAQGVSDEQVGRVYAQQILRSAPAGTWFLDESGRWRQ